MAGSKTNAFSNSLLAYLFRNTSLGLGANLYVALYTVSPGDAGTGTEVSGGSYARVAVPRTTSDWAAPSGGSIAPTNPVNFPQASGSWGTVVAMAILDASSGGNMLYWGDLSASKSVDTGDTPYFAAANLSVLET